MIAPDAGIGKSLKSLMKSLEPNERARGSGTMRLPRHEVTFPEQRRAGAAFLTGRITDSLG